MADTRRRLTSRPNIYWQFFRKRLHPPRQCEAAMAKHEAIHFHRGRICRDPCRRQGRDPRALLVG